MSQISKPGQGGGGGGIETIAGDTGSITGSNVTVFSDQSNKNAGSSVSFVNSGTTSTLNLTDIRGSTYLGLNAGNLVGPGTGGGINTSVGVESLQNVSNGCNANSAFGAGSLNALTEGDFNSAVGVQAGLFVTEGSSNCYFGYLAGYNHTDFESNNIIIGAQNRGVEGESGCIRIGDSTSPSPQTDCYIAGINNPQQGVGTNPFPVFISSEGKLSTMDPGNGFQVPMVFSKSVDARITGPIEITNFPMAGSSGLFIITSITILAAFITGTPGAPVANFGTNAPNYDNFSMGYSTFPDVQNEYDVAQVGGVFTGVSTIPTNTPFFINITTADTSATANVQRIFVQGFYV